MKIINTIKNIAIILDFIVSSVAAQLSDPALSAVLFAASAIILFIAVICVAIEFFAKNK